jgi:alpha-galactosidase
VANFGLGADEDDEYGPVVGENLAPGSRRVRSVGSKSTGLESSQWLELSPDGTTLRAGRVFTNRGEYPIGLGRQELWYGYVRMGEQAEDTVMLCCSGTTSPSRVRRLDPSGEPLVTKTLAQLYSAETKLAFQAAFVTFDRMNAEHRVEWSGDSVRVVSYCDFAGWELPPGETVETETLVLRMGADPLACLEAWADDVVARYQPRIWPKVPAGWVGWAWVDGFNVEPYESVVLRNVEAIRRRLPGHDLEYVWVSIGNLKGGLPGNWLEWNTDLFPRGVDFLVGELAKLDFRLGLWMGAFWMADASKERMEELREALLLKNGQPMVTSQRWSYGEAGLLPVEERPNMLALDPTHPKTHAYLGEVLQTYYAWGVRYYMIDFLHAVSGSTPGDFIPDGYHDPSLIPGPETYRRGLQALREAAGEDTYLLSSTGPTYQNLGYMDAARVGNDYGEGRALNPNSGFYPATFVINNAGFWTSHRAASDAMAAGYFTHRKLYLADSGNLLTVDKPIPLGEAQIAATIFGLNGGPMMLGDDIDRMTEERLALIRKCLPRLPECARPVDLFDCPEPDYVKTFHLRVETAWDEWDLWAVLNYGPEPLRRMIPASQTAAPALTWDFWGEKYEGERTDGFEAWVAPFSATVLRLSRARGHPWIISTDMHVRQGQAEIQDCRWDPGAMALTFRASRPAGESGNVFVHVPAGLCIVNPEGLWIAKDANDSSLIVRVALQFGEEPEERTIRFAPV